MFYGFLWMTANFIKTFRSYSEICFHTRFQFGAVVNTQFICLELDLFRSDVFENVDLFHTATFFVNASQIKQLTWFFGQQETLNKFTGRLELIKHRRFPVILNTTVKIFYSWEISGLNSETANCFDISSIQSFFARR